MSKINFDDYCVKRLDLLKKEGYPDSPKIPMEAEEIQALRIGTACYVISTGYPVPRLMMFLGYFEKGIKGEAGFIFCGNKGEYKYKARNVGNTYNVFRTM